MSLLRSIGCEYGQGFFYGEPMSEREVLALLKVARRAERRMSKKGGLLRQRPRPDEAPATPAPGPTEPSRGGPAAQAAPAANGVGPPPVPAARGSPDARAPANPEHASAPETTRQPAGPPPLPITRLPETADDGVRLRTLLPTPLRPGSTPEPASDAPEHDTAPPVRTGPPPLPSAQGLSPPPLAEARHGALPAAPAQPNGLPRPNPRRCRRPSPNALPSLPGEGDAQVMLSRPMI